MEMHSTSANSTCQSRQGDFGRGRLRVSLKLQWNGQIVVSIESEEEKFTQEDSDKGGFLWWSFIKGKEVRGLPEGDRAVRSPWIDIKVQAAGLSPSARR